MIKLAKIISTFFGLGLFPLAPGTLASLVIIILYKYFLFRLPWVFYLIIVLFITAAGVYFSTIYSRSLSLKDPGKIVIDEVSGQLLAIFLIKPDWFTLVICFVLFRFLDIIKPMGIKKLENLPQGWGIMADDLGCGLLVSIVVHLSIWLF